MTDQKAKQIIRDLLEAAYDGALAETRDRGHDIVFSQIKGHKHRPMSLDEAERRLDRAICAAWRAITGKRVNGDPFDFVQEDHA